MLDATILDYYHLRHHTVECAKVLYGEGADEAAEWQKTLIGTLNESGPLEVVTELGTLAKNRRGRKRRALKRLQGYVGKRLEMLDYPRFLAEGFQTGSGPTEAQCKSLGGRLKGRGRRWNPRGVNAHMAVDCLYNNSDHWTTYWPQAQMP